MDKGTVLYQGIVIGEIERKESEGQCKYLFTYDLSFNEYFELAELEFRAEPYELDNVPCVITGDLEKIAPEKLVAIRQNHHIRDEFDLWLACCDADLIEEDTGYRST